MRDLAALAPHVGTSPQFEMLVRQAVAGDAPRGGQATALSDPAELFTGMLERLRSDELWSAEYVDLVRQVSFAGPSEQIGFDRAFAAVAAMTKVFGVS